MRSKKISILFSGYEKEDVAFQNDLKMLFSSIIEGFFMERNPRTAEVNIKKEKRFCFIHSCFLVEKENIFYKFFESISVTVQELVTKNNDNGGILYSFGLSENDEAPGLLEEGVKRFGDVSTYKCALIQFFKPEQVGDIEELLDSTSIELIFIDTYSSCSSFLERMSKKTNMGHLIVSKYGVKDCYSDALREKTISSNSINSLTIISNEDFSHRDSVKVGHAHYFFQHNFIRILKDKNKFFSLHMRKWVGTYVYSPVCYFSYAI